MALTAEQQALDFNPELQDVSRQRKLAELLMAKGLEQPQGQMISGNYVAPSWTQQLQPLANAIIGTSAANTNGGSTTWNSGAYTAGGGSKGNATTAPTSSGGAGGTGTYAGGTGGVGAFGTVASKIGRAHV